LSCSTAYLVGIMPVHFMPYNSTAPALQTCIMYLDLLLHSSTVTENCAKVEYFAGQHYDKN